MQFETVWQELGKLVIVRQNNAVIRFLGWLIVECGIVERKGRGGQMKKRFLGSMILMVAIVFCTGAITAGANTATDAIGNNNPWVNMGGTGQAYTYSQTGYYQGSYIFELGWNLNEEGYNFYADRTEIVLSDLTSITVSFDKSCKDVIQDQKMVADLKKLMEKLKKQYSDSDNPLYYPLVISVEFIGDSELTKLADEYYTNGKMTRFSAIFTALDIEIQKEYCNRMIEEKKLSFFSSCAPNMNKDILGLCAEKAYQKNRLTFFDAVAPYLTNDQRQEWVARTTKDHRITFLDSLTEETDPE
jgi:hypothetical protein